MASPIQVDQISVACRVKKYINSDESLVNMILEVSSEGSRVLMANSGGQALSLHLYLHGGDAGHHVRCLLTMQCLN